MRGWCILAACRNGAGYITPSPGNEVKNSVNSSAGGFAGFGAAGWLKGESGPWFSGWRRGERGVRARVWR